MSTSTSPSIRTEGFSLSRLENRERNDSGMPKPAGSIVVLQNNREIWLSVIDWGDRIDVSSPYSSLKLVPQRTPVGLDDDNYQLWRGETLDWLAAVQEVLDRRYPLSGGSVQAEPAVSAPRDTVAVASDSQGTLSNRLPIYQLRSVTAVPAAA